MGHPSVLSIMSSVNVEEITSRYVHGSNKKHVGDDEDLSVPKESNNQTLLSECPGKLWDKSECNLQIPLPRGLSALKVCTGDFSDGPVIKTFTSKAGSEGLVPGWGTKIPHASWPKSQNRKWSTLKKKILKSLCSFQRPCGFLQPHSHHSNETHLLSKDF